MYQYQREIMDNRGNYMTTDKQTQYYEEFKKSILASIKMYEVQKGAICIETPFLDWKGVPCKFYITSDGIVTDGGMTANQLAALRVIDDFDEWPFRLDYLSQYCIEYDGSHMRLSNRENGTSSLRFVQGLARLPGFFEPKPIYSTEDRFPEKVRHLVVEMVESNYPKKTPSETRAWASSMIKPRNIHLKNGFTITSDLSPMRENRIVEIISHANANFSQKREHVRSKILYPILWKREKKDIDTVFVMNDIGDYSADSRQLLRSESNDIIQLNETSSKGKLIEMLIENR